MSASQMIIGLLVLQVGKIFPTFIGILDFVKVISLVSFTW